MQRYNFSVFLFALAFVLTVAACDCDDDDDDNDDSSPVDDDAADDDVDDDDTTDDDTTDDDTGDDDTGDDDTVVPLTCYRDADGDGYGDAYDSEETTEEECPRGWVEDDADCDDTDHFINPEAFDFPDDGIDQNCDETDFTRSDDNGIFVTTGGDDGNAGTMAAPKLTIAAAVTAASAAGKAVFVGLGEYNGKTSTDVNVFGGYETSGWTRDIFAYQSVLKSTLQDPTLTVVASSKADPVYLDGLTVRGGTGAAYTRGLRVDADAAAHVYRCAVDGGTGSTNTYGVIMEGESLLLRNSAVLGSFGEVNNAYGVILNEGVAELIANIIDCYSVGNSAVGVAVNGNGEALLVRNEITGGYTCNVSKPVMVNGTARLVDNALLAGDTAVDSMALFVENSGQATAINNYLFGGRNATTAYGVSVENGGTITLVNNIVDGGASSATIAGLRLTGSGSSATLYNNDFHGAGMTVLVSSDSDLADIADVNECAWTGCTAAADNLSVDPVLDGCNPYHLTDGGSPIIDMGTDPSAWYDGPWIYLDWDWESRPAGDDWDIGVDEYTE